MPYTHTQPHIYYEQEGNGIPLLFVHPPGMGHVTFRHLPPLLRDYTCILPDLRGCGKSEDGPITISALADDLKRLLDHLSLEKIMLCGYSNGGSIVQEFAIKYPERTIAAAIIGGFPEVNTFLLKHEFKLGLWATKNNHMTLLSDVIAAAHELQGEYRVELKNYIKAVSSKTLHAYYKAGIHYTSTNRLHQVSCPFLVLYGSRDDYVHAYRHMFVSQIKGVEIVLVDGVGHQIPTKKPRTLAYILRDFGYRAGR
ncbi:alpha/beta hydrolase [Paenalkalicoccus suaedae]|uniref:Alpha/beta hydrolase n=1 Tax=Paenalkalicoccus suaedae TaxID=2592382 RepID=A0A859FI69_9BACI|nr:alpha/beta hydrolase [Paenalkalicoccus suaedae]QKS72801.1 alpha/beta hydrolase [Paenalkalicoccus suaedae]